MKVHQLFYLGMFCKYLVGPPHALRTADVNSSRCYVCVSKWRFWLTLA